MFNKFKGPAPKVASGNDKAPEKQDWNKFKQDKKDLKLKRKKDCNDLFELTVEGKKIYEELKWLESHITKCDWPLTMCICFYFKQNR